MKKFLIITVSLSTLFLVWCQTTTSLDPEIENPIDKTQEITWNIQNDTWNIQEQTGFMIESFDDCINAGFPIMESYPRQCNDGTTTYTEEIKEAPQEDLIDNTEVLTWKDLTWENLGTNLETTQETSTWKDLSILQQRLKAALERRNQENQDETQSETQNETQPITPSTTTSWGEQVSEEDIEYLENLIENLAEEIKE